MSAHTFQAHRPALTTTPALPAPAAASAAAARHRYPRAEYR